MAMQDHSVSHPSRLHTLLSAGLLAPGLLVSESQASGQYEVDDAALADPSSVETEIWHNDRQEASFLSFTGRGKGRWQATAELETAREAAEEVYGLEGKYLLREMEQHGYGLGVVAGTGYSSALEDSTETSLVVPASMELVPERVTAHANLGTVHDHDADETDGLWGVAAEVALAGPLSGIAETFGTGDDEPSWQAGLHAEILDGQLVADLSWIDDREADADGWAFGIGLQPIRF